MVMLTLVLDSWIRAGTLPPKGTSKSYVLWALAAEDIVASLGDRLFTKGVAAASLRRRTRTLGRQAGWARSG